MAYNPDKIEVLLEGHDEPLIILADQRDLAAWEGSDVNDPERNQPVTATRWVAWRAGRRSGQLAMSWEKFGEQCLKASVVSEPEPDGGEGDDADPLAG